MKRQTYEQFVEKFKQKKTKDDCYTPQEVYEIVKRYFVKKYDLDEHKIVRPFWPGYDYEKFDYPKDCIVLDNPPFSIITKIVKFYEEKGIKYILFAPALTFFNINKGKSKYLVCRASITYENGAKVSTSFVTNLGDYKVETIWDLKKQIEDLFKNPRRKINFPDFVISGARMKLCQDKKFKQEELQYVTKYKNECIFGGGFLIINEVNENDNI